MKKILLYLLFVLNLAVMIWFWWSNSGAMLRQGGGSTLIALGRLAGLLAVYSILMQVLLIGRTIWIEQLFGLDRLARVHHINGHTSLIFIILHPILITLGYASLSKTPVIPQFLSMLRSLEDVFQAFIALILFIIIVGFSIYIVRRKLKYETWYYIHIFMYTAILMAWGHQLHNGEDFLASKTFVLYWYALYAFVFGNLLIFRFLRPLYRYYQHRFYIEKIVPETKDTNSVYITGQNMHKFKFQAGQFVKVRFLDKQHIWQNHPFSLSQSPNGKNIRLSIKAVGDFTKTVPDLKIGTKVYIDGPYGIFTEKIINKDKILCIAGGIGITPIRSLLEQIAPKGKDIILLYGNKTSDDIVFQKELDQIAAIGHFPIHHVLSNAAPSQGTYLQGFIDKEKIQSLVQDLLKREIFLCGPPVMMEKVIKTLRELGVKHKDIHYEKFSL